MISCSGVRSEQPLPRRLVVSPLTCGYRIQMCGGSPSAGLDIRSWRRPNPAARTAGRTSRGGRASSWHQRERGDRRGAGCRDRAGEARRGLHRAGEAPARAGPRATGATRPLTRFLTLAKYFWPAEQGHRGRPRIAGPEPHGRIWASPRSTRPLRASETRTSTPICWHCCIRGHRFGAGHVVRSRQTKAPSQLRGGLTVHFSTPSAGCHFPRSRRRMDSRHLHGQDSSSSAGGSRAGGASGQVSSTKPSRLLTLAQSMTRRNSVSPLPAGKAIVIPSISTGWCVAG